jgi:Tfp pilus assembly protein PilF
MAEQYLAVRKIDEARTCLMTARTHSPSLVEAHFGSAKLERSLGHHLEVERALRAAVEANPRSGRPAHLLGCSLVEHDRLSEAFPSLYVAAHWEPTVAEHHRSLATAQLFLGDIVAGRSSLARAVELDTQCSSNSIWSAALNSFRH